MRGRLGVCACLLTVALGLSHAAWSGPVRWSTDALFYEAQSRELGGTPAEQARREVFRGPIGRSLPRGSTHVADARWVEYSAPFYRRRWVLPVLGAAVRPIAGDRSLAIVAYLGYLASILLVFALARIRYGARIAFAVGVFAAAFPPLRFWGGYPLTDTLGVAALALAVLAGIRALEGPRWRLVPWAASVALLALTRDSALIVVGAAIYAACSQRTRRSLAVALTALGAALPVPLLVGASARRALAYAFAGNNVPADDSWRFVASQYLPHVRWMLEQEFPLRIPLAPGTLLLALTSLLFLPAPRSAYLTFVRGSAVGALGFLFVLPAYTSGRYTLILVPFAALGLAAFLRQLAELPPFGLGELRGRALRVLLLRLRNAA